MHLVNARNNNNNNVLASVIIIIMETSIFLFAKNKYIEIKA